MKGVEKEGCAFEIIPEADVPAALPRLRAVSDDWLAAKSTREKAFSIGYFDETYISSAPVAVIKQGAEIVAFANLWEGAGREELSVDLMRYASIAHDGVMDYLFIQLMLWGHEQGYGLFNLGMAPLSGDWRIARWRRYGAGLGHCCSSMQRTFTTFRDCGRTRKSSIRFGSHDISRRRAGFHCRGLLTRNVSTLVSGSLKGVVSK